jgi:hypothetical protein
MYQVSVQKERAIIELKLTGAIDPSTMSACATELESVMRMLGPSKFYLLIDHSEAERFEGDAAQSFFDLKDRALLAGAIQILSIAKDAEDMDQHTTARLQQVMEGRELFCLEMPDVEAPKWQQSALIKSA